MQKQKLENLSEEKKLENSKNIKKLDIVKKEEYLNFCLDFSEELEDRIKLFEKIEESTQYEIIQKLITLYNNSSSHLIHEYLLHISNIHSLPLLLRLSSIRELGTEKSYEKLDELCSDTYNKNISTTLKLEMFTLLLKDKKYNVKSKKYFDYFLNDKIDSLFKYKSILSLKNKDVDESTVLHFIYTFFNSKTIEDKYKILCAQYILKNEKYENEKTINFLISFVEDDTRERKLRGDACDILLQTKSGKNKGKELIHKLGKENGGIQTVYNNTENVHTEEVEKNIEEILDYLSTIKITEEDFYKIREKILTIDNRDPIVFSLDRIEIDFATYSKHHYTLRNILIKLWNYINSHESREELTRRLIEELESSDGYCSSGYCSRLLNILTGYTKFGIRISYEDQIVSNFQGRLNKRIRDISDEKERENILNEMILPASDFFSRKTFLRFLNKNIHSLRIELYEEFKEYVDETSFELYFRKALMNYEAI